MKPTPHIFAGSGSVVIALSGIDVIDFATGNGNGVVPGSSSSDVLDLSPGKADERKSTVCYNRLCKKLSLFELCDSRRVTLNQPLPEFIAIDSADDSMNRTTVTADYNTDSSVNDISQYAPVRKTDQLARSAPTESCSGCAPRINYTSKQAIKALSGKFARLSSVLEQRLVSRARHNPKNLEKRLVRHTMWFIIFQAAKWAIEAKCSYFADFVQEGSIVLLKTFQLYDSAQWASIVTNAWDRVKRAMISYVRTSIAVVLLSEYAHRQGLAKKLTMLSLNNRRSRWVNRSTRSSAPFYRNLAGLVSCDVMNKLGFLAPSPTKPFTGNTNIHKIAGVWIAGELQQRAMPDGFMMMGKAPLAFIAAFLSIYVYMPCCKAEWGFIDRKGSLLISPRFSGVSSFREGVAIVTDHSKINLIDLRGNMISVPSGVSQVKPVSDNLAAVELSADVDGRDRRSWGYIHRTGKWAIWPNFSACGSFSEGIATVEVPSVTNDKPNASDCVVFAIGKDLQFISTSGRIAFPQRFDLDLLTWTLNKSRFSCGRAAVKKNGLYGFIDQHGDYVIEPKYSDARPFSENRAAVSINSREEKDNILINKESWGFVAATGEEVIKPQFISVTDFKEGLAFVITTQGRYLVIDPEGRECFKALGDIPDGFSEGVAVVRWRDQCWFINRGGEDAGLGTFEDARPFSEGLAAVKQKGLWGAIDHKGTLVVPTRFANFLPYSEGRAAVQVIPVVRSKP